MITRQAIAAEALTWVGTPWKHQAMTKGVGCDCIGFLAGIAYELGLGDARHHMRKPEYRAYGRDPDPTTLLAACADYLDPIPVRQATLGDIFLLRVPRGTYPQHFALVTRAEDKPTHIIHATSAQPRKVVEQRLDEVWTRRIARAFSYRGVA